MRACDEGARGHSGGRQRIQEGWRWHEKEREGKGERTRGLIALHWWVRDDWRVVVVVGRGLLHKQCQLITGLSLVAPQPHTARNTAYVLVLKSWLAAVDSCGSSYAAEVGL